MFELLMFFIINMMILNAFFKYLLFTKKKEADAFLHEHFLLNLEYIICILIFQSKDKHSLHQMQHKFSLNHLCQKCENISTM